MKNNKTFTAVVLAAALIVAFITQPADTQVPARSVGQGRAGPESWLVSLTNVFKTFGNAYTGTENFFPIGCVRTDSPAAISSNGNWVRIACDENGIPYVNLATLLSATDGDSINALPTATATTANGTSTCYLPATASTNSTNCKASAGNVYLIRPINTTSTLYYLRMYNLASAPTCSSATGFVETIPIPHGTGTGGGVVSAIAVGQAYSTGIGFCITGGGSSTDNTNAATGVFLTVLFK